MARRRDLSDRRLLAEGARNLRPRYKVLLIADEIITGFGRTGRRWGLEHWNVKPDIISFAKGVTSGYVPLGGIMVTKRYRILSMALSLRTAGCTDTPILDIPLAALWL